MDEIQVFFLDGGLAVRDVIDDPVFSHVTNDGEIYVLFEVVAISREYLNHPLGWTHGVMVKHCDSNREFRAEIKVKNFSIEDSDVYEFP